MSKHKDHPFKQFLNSWDPKSKLDGELTRKALQDVKNSGLTAATLEEAGVKLFKGAPDDLKKKLGFAQVEGQSLLASRRLIEIPYCAEDGSILRYEFKCIPEVFFKGEGKAHKYLQQKNQPPRPYITQSVWKAKDKPHELVWLTEGVKKVLKLLQHGRAAIGISGTPNWKAGKNSALSDDKDIWSDLKAFRLEGRLCFIAFDMDVWTKVQVRRDLYGLAFALFMRGATIKFPQWQTGKGIDDCLAGQQDPEATLNKLEAEAIKLESFLCHEHSNEIIHALDRLVVLDPIREKTLYGWIAKALNLKVSDLKKRAAERKGHLLQEAVKDAAIEDFFIGEDGGVYRLVSTRDGGKAQVRLSNFSARILEERDIDDEIEDIRKEYVVQVNKNGHTFKPFSIPCKDFRNVSLWVSIFCGNSAIIEPGQNIPDFLRAFFQKRSDKLGVIQRTIFRHTGWREVNGEMVFLHAGGALGCDGVFVDLHEELTRAGHYRLPDSPVYEKEALDLIFTCLVDVAPFEIILPLLSFTFLTSIKSLLDPKPGFSLFCYGLPDSFKTSVTVLFQGFFGSIAKEGLANFSSTVLGTQKKAALLKDIIMIADDFHPSPSRKESEKREDILERLIRDSGNNQGRTKLNSDSSIKKSSVPRAGIIITGELQSSLQSTISRYITIEFQQKDISIENLTKVQKQAHLLAHAMAGFLLWVKKRIKDLQGDFLATFQDLRAGLFIDGSTSRKLPEHTAFLLYGLRLFLQWAHERGSISTDVMQAYLEEGRSTFIKIGTRHSERLKQADPTRLFFETIGAVVRAGFGRIDDVETGYNDHEGDGKTRPIGFKDNDFYYFIPTDIWHTVKEYLAREYTYFPDGNRHVFYEKLAMQGFLEVRHPGEHTITHRIGKKSPRVLKIKRSKADEIMNIGTIEGEADHV